MSTVRSAQGRARHARVRMLGGLRHGLRKLQRARVPPAREADGALLLEDGARSGNEACGVCPERPTNATV